MIFLYILCGIVAVILILMLIAPRESTVSRSVTVNVSPEAAFAHLRSLANHAKWSPWNERDPNMEKGYRGKDGEVGSVYWWTGNKQVGQGEQEITALTPNSKVDIELRFMKPFKAVNQTWFLIEPDGAGSKVTWGFYATFKPPMNIMMMFMNMDKALGNDFQNGLDKFKTTIEA